MSRFAHRIVATALGVAVMGITPVAAKAADSEPGKPARAQTERWTKLLAVDLLRHDLGLAALARKARRLGLARSGGLRLVSEFSPPSSAGGASFAYFDREDATIGEEARGVIRDWEVPSRELPG